MNTKKKKPVKKTRKNKRLQKAILKVADKKGHGDLLRAMLKSGKLEII